MTESFYKVAFAFPLMIAGFIGLVMCELGVALICDRQRWNKKAKLVKGTVVGARSDLGSKGQTFYYRVFEYADLQGKIVQQTDKSMGSSSANFVKPGQKVMLYLNPDKPDEIRTKNAAEMIVGIILLAIGVGMICAVGNELHPSPETGIAVVLLLLWIAHWFFKNKRDKPLTITQFKEEMRMKREAKAKAWEDKPLLDAKSVEVAQKKQDVVTGKVAWVTLLVGLGLLYFGIKFGSEMEEILTKGVHAPGAVIRVDEYHDSDGSMYHTVVGYTAKDGSAQEFKETFGTNPPLDSVGDKVEVIYQEDGTHDPIIDRGIYNWVLSGVLTGFGMLLVFGSLSALQKASRRKDHL